MLENVLNRLRNLLELRPWFTLSYGRLKLKLPKNPRKGICECCGVHGWTNIHHIFYRYRYNEVRKQNRLALNYTNELCYPDHHVAEAIRRLFDIDPKIKIKTTSAIVNRLIELRAEAIERGENGWKYRS